MNNPLWGTRREVVLSLTLVAFASAAIAAAQWRTYGAAPAADPLVIEEEKVTFGRGGDLQLGPAAAPLFTLEVGSPSDPVGSGGEIALPGAIFAGVGSGNGYGSASYSAGAGFTFGADVGSGSKPRRSSSGSGSGVGGGGGGGFGFGGGAWGGVSGSAARPTSTGASAAVAVRSSGNGAPKLARETFGSAGGGASAGKPGDSPGFSSSAPGIEAAALGIKVSELQGDAAPRSPGSAPTPEPVTLLLVGLGAAALYGARRHFV